MTGIHRLHDREALPGSNVRDVFAADIIQGLSLDHKKIPCRYLYDDRGSELFKAITNLDEYYLTECEIEIIRNYGSNIAEIVGCEECNVVELGAGDGIKTVMLLQALYNSGTRVNYVPIDISESAIQGIGSRLMMECPDVPVNGIVSEYFHGLKWLSGLECGRNIVLFLGSNIGNFDHVESEQFLNALNKALNPGDYILIGFDMVKDIELILKAYNDPDGITAEFNRNILKRINIEFKATFDIETFEYQGTWNSRNSAVISNLKSIGGQSVHIQDLDRYFYFDAGEGIHTESSFKFTAQQIESLAIENSFTVSASFSDSRDYFTDSLWRVI